MEKRRNSLRAALLIVLSLSLQGAFAGNDTLSTKDIDYLRKAYRLDSDMVAEIRSDTLLVKLSKAAIEGRLARRSGLRKATLSAGLAAGLLIPSLGFGMGCGDTETPGKACEDESINTVVGALLIGGAIAGITSAFYFFEYSGKSEAEADFRKWVEGERRIKAGRRKRETRNIAPEPAKESPVDPLDEKDP